MSEYTEGREVQTIYITDEESLQCAPDGRITVTLEAGPMGWIPHLYVETPNEPDTLFNTLQILGVVFKE